MTYKQWVNGDILQAADQNNVSNQCINRFADATARDAAISSPTEHVSGGTRASLPPHVAQHASWLRPAYMADSCMPVVQVPPLR